MKRFSCLDVTTDAGLETPQKKGQEFLFHCPNHQDKHPSLAINPTKDVWLCGPCRASGNPWSLAAFFAGCQPDDKQGVIRWLRDHGLFNSGGGKGNTGKEFVRSYLYEDENGDPLFKINRYRLNEPPWKNFAIHRPDGHGGWIPGKGNVEIVPYHLTDILKNQLVAILEGEDDANNLQEWIPATTTNPFGALNWPAIFDRYFKDKDCLIFLDNDETGERRGLLISTNIFHVAKAMKIIRLPGLPPKGDFSDWKKAGGTKEQLQEIVAAAAVLTQEELEDWAREIEGKKEQFNPGSTSDATDIPLPDDEVAPFPLEVLPAPFRHLAEEGAKAINCPVDFLGVSMLVFAGAAIGCSRVLCVKPGWEEGPGTYSAIVGDPGTKKSPALKLGLKPHTNRQNVLASEYDEAEQQYEVDLAVFEVAEASWKKAIKDKTAGPEDKPQKPEPPVMRQVYTTDSTIEALGDLLKNNTRGVLFYQDELTSWVHSMNQYRGGKGADRQHWLSFWNSAPIVLNRRNRQKPLVLSRPFVNVCGGLCPDILGDLSDEQGREDGFIHRVLFSFPDPIPNEWTEATLNPSTAQEYEKVFQHLWKLDPTADQQGNPIPVKLGFTPEGKTIWVQWITAHHQEVNQIDFPANLRGPWSKLEAYCARLALILQECRYASGEVNGEGVDEISVAGAADLVDYFKSHAKRVYARLFETKEDRKVTAAINWIKNKGGSTTLRDFITYKVAGVKNKKEAEDLFQEIQQRGYARIEEVTPPGGGRKTVWLHLCSTRQSATES